MLRFFKKTDMNEEDGGIVKKVNADAPKIINSTQIMIFECKFSTFSFIDADEEIGNRVYILEANLENEFVNGRYRQRSRFENNVDVVFKAEPSFMERLQRIIEEHARLFYPFSKYRRTGIIRRLIGTREHVGTANSYLKVKLREVFLQLIK